MAAMAMATPAATTSRGGWGRVALVGLGTVIATVLANLIVYYIGAAIVGYNPDFVVLATNGGTIFFTVIPAIVAVLLYAALLRFTSRPARIFTIIAAVVFVVALIPDFTYIPTVVGASNGQTAILVVMHIVAAVVIVGLLTKFARLRGR